MITDAVLGFFLSLANTGLDLIPTWSPSLPSLSAFTNPLEQLNWLVGIDLVFGVVLTVLLLGPALLAARVVLWVVGLATPGGTRN